MEINSSAPIVSRQGITINAPIEAVWKLHTEVAGWPDWNSDIVRAALNGPVATGTVFHWETLGLAISSTIGEVVPLRKLAWSGVAGDVLGIHVWTFSSDKEGTHVFTEESLEGPSLPEHHEDLQRALDDSLVRWLASLRDRAEDPDLYR
jgi:uncharacterized protein YndB with AHSA1/START domain